MKVSKKDILDIKPGTSMCFHMDSYKDCVSVQKYAYQLCKIYPRANIKRYSTSIDVKTNCITVTALKK